MLREGFEFANGDQMIVTFEPEQAARHCMRDESALRRIEPVSACSCANRDGS